MGEHEIGTVTQRLTAWRQNKAGLRLKHTVLFLVSYSILVFSWVGDLVVNWVFIRANRAGGIRMVGYIIRRHGLVESSVACK